MARGTHVTIVTGSLSADPEGFDGSKEKGCSFAIPCNEKWGEEEHQQHTEWYNVSCYKGAEAHLKHLKKGSIVQVRGRLRTRVTEDGKRFTNLVADRVDYISTGVKNETADSDAPF